MATEYIDLTPSWEAAARVYIMVLQNGNAEGRKAATEDLLRMARIADAYVASRNTDRLGIGLINSRTDEWVNKNDIVELRGEKYEVFGAARPSADNNMEGRVHLRYPGFPENADSNKAVKPELVGLRFP